MATAKGTPAAGSRRTLLEILFVLLLYGVLILSTSPIDLADTTLYAGEIASHYYNPTPETLSRIFEFGHVLWRPLFVLYLDVADNFLREPFQSRTATQLFLIKSWKILNIVLGALTLLIFNSTLRQLNLNFWSRLFAVLVFASATAFLNHTRSGCSYLAGLLFTTVSLWAGVRAITGDRAKTLFCVFSGVCLAIACGFWFTYVLVAPAIALLPFWLPAGPPTGLELRTKISMGTVTSLAFGLGLLLIFTPAALTLGIDRFAEVYAWIDESRHGLRQTVKPIRAVMGVPRCCLEIGEAGITWKRWLFKDPYNPVSLHQALAAGIPLLSAFYFSAFVLVLTLWKAGRNGRKVLAGLALSFGMVFLFAIFLHEPSSRERFLPAFPFVFMALGVYANLLKRPWWLVPIAFLALQLVVNARVLNYSAVQNDWATQYSRLEQLQDKINERDGLFLLSLRDEIYQLAKQDPLHWYPRHLPYPRDIIEVATSRVYTWRREFAEFATDYWARGGHVWISKRVLAERPKPEWLWVEGEDPAIKWSDIPAFFRQLEFDMDVGGDDGFVRLAKSEHNRKILEALLANSTQTANDEARGQ